MMPAMITVIGPVGPDTCAGVPPKGAAISPKAIAPHNPAIAPAPEVAPKAMARGKATTAVVNPPVRSPRQLLSQVLRHSRLARRPRSSGGS